MRICVITRATPLHSSGGMENVAFDLASEWARTGHCVRVVTTPLPDGVVVPENLGFEIQTLPGKPGRYTTGWSRAVASLTMDADIVLGVSSAARRLAGSTKAPVVMQAHGTSLDEIRTKARSRSARSMARMPRNALWLGIDALDYRRYRAVVGVGPSVTRTIRDDMPKWTQPRVYREIPNGVPPRENGGPGVREGALFVGRLHREKGVDLAVRAVHGTGIQLAICGEGPYLSPLRQLVEELGMLDQVTFLGRESARAVRSRMRAAQAVIVPTRRVEGLPLVVLESLVEGTPVVGSDLLVQGFGARAPYGLLGCGSSAESLRGGLVDAIGGKFAHDRIQAEAQVYEIEAVACRYVALFEELVESQ